MTISTRSGSWISPNYISGFPIDWNSCRAVLALPWQLTTHILESKVKTIYGDLRKVGLNQNKRLMQTQVAISPTLIHYIQRKQINIAPNVTVNENYV